MAIIELAYPQLKRDPAAIEFLTATQVPKLVKALKEGGVIRALRGFIRTDDGRHVSDDMREVLLIEWPSETHFSSFVASQPFLDFVGAIKPHIEGPPSLKLFRSSSDHEDGNTAAFFAHPLVEVLEVRPRATKNGEPCDPQRLLSKIENVVQKHRGPRGTERKTVAGASLNLEEGEVVVLSSYQGEDDLEASSDANKALLEELRVHADVSQFVVDRVVVEV